jgi:hypothetical protein
MTPDQTRVAIVVLPDFEAELAELAQRAHVWLVDTPSNRRAAERVWATGTSDRTHGVTTFKVDPGAPSETWIVEILPVVDEHHGLRAEWATDVVLEVRGLAVTPKVLSALQELGPFSLEEDQGGFIARRQFAV